MVELGDSSHDFVNFHCEFPYEELVCSKNDFYNNVLYWYKKSVYANITQYVHIYEIGAYFL